jgi:hypothetical protein
MSKDQFDLAQQRTVIIEQSKSKGGKSEKLSIVHTGVDHGTQRFQ